MVPKFDSAKFRGAVQGLSPDSFLSIGRPAAPRPQPFLKSRSMRCAALFVAAVAGLIAVAVVRAAPARAQSAPTAAAPLPSFEVASVRPSNLHGQVPIGVFTYPGGKVAAGLCTVKMLVMFAFDVQAYQVSGGPGWINDDRFDITAVPPSSSQASKLNPPSPKVPPNVEQRQMLISLLIDRFQLKFHHTNQTGAVYALERNSGRLKLEDSKNKDQSPWIGSVGGGALNGDGLAGSNISMPQLAASLSGYLARPVVDRTGLNGTYDFKYPYSEADTERDIVSCIFTSLKGLGLSLKAAKGPVERVVIDHVERPTEN